MSRFLSLLPVGLAALVALSVRADDAMEREMRAALLYEGETIAWVQVAVDRPRDGEEAQLLSYLQDFIGFEATEATLRAAEDRLMRLGRYKAAVCRLWTEEEHRGRLKCGLARARTIRRILIEGLPAQLLETDLRKRIFMRPGERLDRRDRSGRDRVGRQRTRIEEYLRRQGYYGAKVEVVTPPVSQSADVDVLIRITGGAFVHVHEVRVEDAGPISESKLEGAFGWMCLAGDALIDAFETFELRCFTRDQLRSTTDRFEKELRELGYPEGRLRVNPVVIDPLGDDVPRGCGATHAELQRAKKGGAAPAPKCVDLEVKVTAGPRLEVKLKVARGYGAFDDRLDAPEALKFVDGYFRLAEASVRAVRRQLVEPSSRLIQVMFHDEVEAARDGDLYFTDLEGALTFDSARAADAVEAEQSRLALLDMLGERGRFDARVEMKHEATADGFKVEYRIIPGPVSGIERIRFFGNHAFSAEEIAEKVPLSTALRSTNHTGFVSQTELDNDVQRLLEFYEQQGYREADVRVEAFRNRNGGTEVHFRIDEGERFGIARLLVNGGVEELLPELLGVIAHCQTGASAKEGRPPRTPEDCRDNAFLPDQFDLDQKRILNLYASRGYPYTAVEVNPGFGEEGAEVIIDIRKDGDAEGTDEPPEPVKLGEIFIDGNDTTDRSVILRELDLKNEAGATSFFFGAGDAGEPLLAPVHVAEGASRLRRTGLFSRVRYDYIGLDDDGERAHLLVQLEERPTLTWDASAAFSTDRLFSVRTEVRDRNLVGRMLDLDLLADVGLFIGRYSIVQAQGRWPRFFGFPIWFKVAPAAIYEDRPAAIVSRTPSSLGPVDAKASWFAGDPRRRNLKGLTAFGVEWRPPHQDFVAGVDFEFRIEWDDAAARPIAPFSLDALATVDGLTEVLKVDPLLVSTFSPRFTYRKIDNPFDPQNGWWLDVSLRGGAPPLNAEFLGQGEIRTAGYYTVGRLTFAGHTRMWAGASYGDPLRKSTLLQQDQLALGGDRSVRGYARDAIGMPDLPGRVQAGEDITNDGFLALGGMQLNAELRFTLIRNFFIGDLKLAAFSDAGFVTYNDRSPFDTPLDVWTNKDSPRVGLSFGAGLRYVLPVGPVAVDFAASPLPDNPWAVHIQFGYPF